MRNVVERLRAEGSAIISGFYTEELRGAEGRLGEGRHHPQGATSHYYLLFPMPPGIVSSSPIREVQNSVALLVTVINIFQASTL